MPSKFEGNKGGLTWSSKTTFQKFLIYCALIQNILFTDSSKKFIPIVCMFSERGYAPLVFHNGEILQRMHALEFGNAILCAPLYSSCKLQNKHI